MPDVLTVREAVTRCKADGLPVSEYTLRHWVRIGALPARKVGQKVLLYYTNVVRFLQCEDGSDTAPATAAAVSGIRRVEL